MNEFVYNNTLFKLNDEILYKKKLHSRIKKYSINEIKKNKNNLIVLKLKEIEEIEEIIEIILEKNVFLKKHFYYENSIVKYVKLVNRKHLIFSYYCDYCNKNHKSNNLGICNDKCIIAFSPYNKNGVNLILKELKFDIVNFSYYENNKKLYNYFKEKKIINMYGMEFENLNDYVLYNYKILLEKELMSERSIVWYVRFIKQFYNNEICKDYKHNFPFLSNKDIDILKEKYIKESKVKNLITTIKKFIKIMSSKDFEFKLDKFNKEMEEIKKYYKNSKLIINKKENKSNKIERKKEKNVKENKSDKKEKNVKEKNVKEKNVKEKSNKIEEKKEIKNEDNLIMNEIVLDIEDCIIKYIDKELEIILINMIKESNIDCFYYKLEEKIESYYFGKLDLWLTIENYGDKIWGISDTNESNPEFIKYKMNLEY